MRTSSWSLESSVVAAELKRFIAEKCAQVRAEVRASGHEMGMESKSLFTAAEKGDWGGVFNSLEAMHEAAKERQGGSTKWDSQVVYPVEWAAVNEIGAALEEFATWPENYAIAFARDIINSIPPGSIYFGGTDPGRFLVTAMSTSHVNADPFFIITQNALIDSRSYLRYVRGMFGSRIYIPTEEDLTKAIEEYQKDARQRKSEGKLLPGEVFEEAEGIVQMRGQIGVWAVDGALSKLMFEKNPEREFYVEESYPLNWMYPHLSPNGLIMRINRREISELSDEVVQRDHEYWTRYVGPMVGDWVGYETPILEIVEFVGRVYQKCEWSGFAGDPRYVQNEAPQRTFSKLRSSIGGLYAWRAQNAKGPTEKDRMLKEADFAFRQAFVLCPRSPEVVFRYVNLLVQRQQVDEAMLLVEAALKLEEAAQAGSVSCAVQDNLAASQTRAFSQIGMLLQQLKRKTNK
jgi:hypothetical protein